MKIESSRRVAKSRPVCIGLELHAHASGTFTRISNSSSAKTNWLWSENLPVSNVALLMCRTH
jgi:hypothetical protein